MRQLNVIMLIFAGNIVVSKLQVCCCVLDVATMSHICCANVARWLRLNLETRSLLAMICGNKTGNMLYTLVKFIVYSNSRDAQISTETSYFYTNVFSQQIGCFCTCLTSVPIMWLRLIFCADLNTFENICV